MPLIRSVILALFFTASQAYAAENQSPAHVKLETDLGDIVLELYPDKAPVSVKNFLSYVNSQFYNGTIFHRVVPGYIVQGGGMTFDFVKKKTGEPIKNESDNGIKNNYGTIAMARLPAPDTATSQFFINLRNNDSLNATELKPGYAVFGKVIHGMETVEKIAALPRGRYIERPEAPNKTIRILTAKTMQKSQQKEALSKKDKTHPEQKPKAKPQPSK